MTSFNHSFRNSNKTMRCQLKQTAPAPSLGNIHFHSLKIRTHYLCFLLRGDRSRQPAKNPLSFLNHNCCPGGASPVQYLPLQRQRFLRLGFNFINAITRPTQNTRSQMWYTWFLLRASISSTGPQHADRTLLTSTSADIQKRGHNVTATPSFSCACYLSFVCLLPTLFHQTTTPNCQGP